MTDEIKTDTNLGRRLFSLDGLLMALASGKKMKTVAIILSHSKLESKGNYY